MSKLNEKVVIQNAIYYILGKQLIRLTIKMFRNDFETVPQSLKKMMINIFTFDLFINLYISNETAEKTLCYYIIQNIICRKFNRFFYLLSEQTQNHVFTYYSYMTALILVGI